MKPHRSWIRGLIGGLILLSAGLASAAPTQGSSATRAPSPAGTDLSWWERAREAIAAAEYRITWQERTLIPGLERAWQAPNRAQNFRSYFTREGILVIPRVEAGAGAAGPGAPPAAISRTPEARLSAVAREGAAGGPGYSWSWGLRLRSFGRAGVPAPAVRPELTVRESRIDYERPGLLEWFENRPEGIKHGFVLEEPPATGGPPERGHAPVHLLLAITGNLVPRTSPDGLAVDFSDPAGARIVRYAELAVTDATGRWLPARMESAADGAVRGIRIVIDDQGATYPVTVDPLASSPTWTAEPDQASAEFGYSVATAGDINGDGYSEVIVGARLYDNGQGDEGRAYVYAGLPAGPGGSPWWILESNQGGAELGYSVATAGDVNGDGYSDIIVGARTYDNGEGNEGSAFVFHGSASGLAGGPVAGPGDADWSGESDQAFGFFGVSVAPAGDVNGDGYGDVIVGAHVFDNVEAEEGRAFVYHGSAAGLSGGPNAGPGDADWTAEVDQASAQFGSAVATAGDINGDGYADVVVSAPYYDNGEADEGAVFLYLGSPGGLPGGPAAHLSDADWMVESDQGSALLGQSLATAGDVNGDGYSDLLIMASSYDNPDANEGGAFIFHGSAVGLAGGPSAHLADADWAVEGGGVAVQLGCSGSTAGDVDGDGYADIILGARGYTGGQSQEGAVFLFRGAPAGLPGGPVAALADADWMAASNQASARLGWSAATAGDVNGDGYSDVIAGAILYDNVEADEGRAFVWLGGPDVLAGGLSPSPADADWEFVSGQLDAELGSAAAAAGDVNGDGFGDLIVGAAKFDAGEADEGMVFVFHGGEGGLEPSAAWTMESNQAGALFGTSVGAAGDVNGDGYEDVIIGSPSWTAGGGAVVVAGSPAGLAGGPAADPNDALWMLLGDQGPGYFALSLGTAGDVNGDGRSDVIVGASSYQADPNSMTGPGGAAFVFHGLPSGLTGGPVAGPQDADWTVAGQSGSFLGFSVGTAGDVNGDGFSDVIVGAPSYQGMPVLVPGGGAFVFHGSETGLGAGPLASEGDADWAVWLVSQLAGIGTSVASAGDVNGDGYSDVIVGAPDLTDTHSQEGRVFIYAGGPAGLSDSGLFSTGNAYWYADGTSDSLRFGEKAASAGDVNGDGLSDVIVGASGYSNGESAEGGAWLYLGPPTGSTRSGADWEIEGDQAVARLGTSAGAAGDVNGDGFGDIFVGAPRFADTLTDEGAVFVFHGNAGGGLSLAPRQRRSDDGAPVAPLGLSDAGDAFRLSILGRTPFGRGEVRVEREVAPLGTPLSSTPTQLSSGWTDTGVTGADLSDLVTGLSPESSHHWQVRLRYNPATTPFQQTGRWVRQRGGRLEETDLRTPVNADLGVALSDAADPVLAGDAIDYTVQVSNAGPGSADVTLVDDIPPGTVVDSWMTSQGSCFVVGAVQLSCSLGSMASGAMATIDLTLTTPPAPGTLVNRARALPLSDLDPNDNVSEEATTTLPPAIGDRVWEDLDGDGIQDPGEPGLPGVWAILLDPNGAAQELAQSDPNGGLSFTGLGFGGSYSLLIFAPPSHVFSPPDQGGDDTADSDVDPLTSETPLIQVTEVLDRERWDAGLVPVCIPPDEPVFIEAVALGPGNETILTFQNFNQPSQVTGYNIYRSDAPSGDPSTWPQVATDIVDGDEATPNIQWADTSGDPPPSGVWYYEVAAWNSRCPAEGPF